jgi:amino acid permease
LIVYERPSESYTIYNGSNLTTFDRLSNDNKLHRIWNTINVEFKTMDGINQILRMVKSKKKNQESELQLSTKKSVRWSKMQEWDNKSNTNYYEKAINVK